MTDEQIEALREADLLACDLDTVIEFLQREELYTNFEACDATFLEALQEVHDNAAVKIYNDEGSPILLCSNEEFHIQIQENLKGLCSDWCLEWPAVDLEAQ